MRVALNDSDDGAGLRGNVQLNKYTYIHTYIHTYCVVMYNLINNYIHTSEVFVISIIDPPSGGSMRVA